MSRPYSILIITILIASGLYIIPGTIPRGHSQGNGIGEVCIAPGGATSCPATPPLITSPNTPGVHQVNVAVVVNESAGLYGFDIILLADHTILTPTSVSLTGSLLKGTPVILAECLSGTKIAGASCAPQDTIDTIEVGATSALGSTLTQAPTTGLLFTATYSVNSPATNIPIGFQTGCTGTSTTGLCVTITAPPSAPDPETTQGARFTNAIYFDIQGFNLNTFTPIGSVTEPQRSRTLSPPMGINVTTINGFNGKVAIAVILPPALSNVTASVSPGIAWVNSTDPSSAFFIPPNSVTLIVGANAPPGTYLLNFTGTSGSTQNTLSLTLIIPTPDISITGSTDQTNFNVTAIGHSTITITGLGNFTGVVNLSVSPPKGLNASLVNTQLTVPPKGSPVTTTLNVNTTITDTYLVNVTATAGAIVRATTIKFTALDFTMVAVYPTGTSTLQIQQNKTNSETINFQTIFPYNTTVTLGKPTVQAGNSFPNPTFGISLTCSPTSLILQTIGTSEHINATSCVVTGSVPGNYTVTVPAFSGRITHTVVFTVQVLGPDFTVSPAQTVVTIPVGKSLNMNVTYSSKVGFTGGLTQIQAQFTTSGSLGLTCPSPPAAGFPINRGTVSPTSPIIALLSINTTSSTPPEICYLVVSATFGVLKRSSTITVVMTNTASPHNLEIYSVSISSQSATVGSTVDITITVINLGTVSENSTVVALVGALDVGEMNFTGLGPGQNITETIHWNTATFAAGTYTVGGQILLPSGQTSTQNSIVRTPNPVTLNAANTSVLQSPYFEPAIIAVLIVLVGIVGFMFLQSRRKRPAKQ